MLRIQPVSTAFFLSPVHAHIFVLTGNPRVAGEFYHKIILAAAPFRCRREVPPMLIILQSFFTSPTAVYTIILTCIPASLKTRHAQASCMLWATWYTLLG